MNEEVAMIFAWLRGPAGSPTDYVHSQGACCPTDTVDGIPEAHKACRIDWDYTLRKALQHVRGGDTVPVWCPVCLGTSGTCAYCHSKTELESYYLGYLGLMPKSQREQAADAIREAKWTSAIEFLQAGRPTNKSTSADSL